MFLGDTCKNVCKHGHLFIETLTYTYIGIVCVHTHLLLHMYKLLKTLLSNYRMQALPILLVDTVDCLSIVMDDTEIVTS